MNLAFVVHDFDPGLGQGRYCLELALRLARSHDVTIYANRFAVEPRPGWRFVRVPAWRTTALTTVFTFLAASHRRVLRGGHEVVHAQGLTCWHADVITAHICNAARRRVAPPPTFRATLFPALVNPVERRFYRQRRARHLIAISQRVAREIVTEYGWNKALSVIHHGVDTRQFHPPENPAARRAARERFQVPTTGWLWLFVGEAVKGLAETIVQLAAFPQAQLLAISRSPREPYDALARTLRVEDRFHFRGPERQLAPAYRAADVFVYPSNYDTFGLVVSEAMATGLPVIVGRDIGAAELITHGVNGLTVDPASADALHGALTRLSGSPELAARLGAAARQTAEQQTWDACAAATEAVYLGPARLASR
jgi:glycosyltransferase involved in cell wall biosynthesis